MATGRDKERQYQKNRSYWQATFAGAVVVLLRYFEAT